MRSPRGTPSWDAPQLPVCRFHDLRHRAASERTENVSTHPPRAGQRGLEFLLVRDSLLDAIEGTGASNAVSPDYDELRVATRELFAGDHNAVRCAFEHPDGGHDIGAIGTGAQPRQAVSARDSGASLGCMGLHWRDHYGSLARELLHGFRRGTAT